MLVKGKLIGGAISVLLSVVWCSLAIGGEIHDAAEKGDLAKVKELLKSDASLLNARLPSNKATPLIFAITYCKPEVAKYLIEKGADVNARASNGHTALHYASAYGQTDIVKLLLAKGASVNFDVQASAEGEDPGCTPLLYAAENGQLEIVKLLLQKGADVNAKSSYNTVHQCATPLIGATKVEKNYARMGDLPGSRVTTTKKHGYLEIVQLLLEKGAKPDELDNFGHTALFHAASNGQVDVVKLLLDKGAGVDVDGKNRNGTPLLFAAQNGDVEVVSLLLAKGANPNAECNSNDAEGKPWTPLKIAKANNFTNVVDLLQKAVKP
jgi:ankyrin repeat protein